jgi:hypothetical protein
MRLDYQFQNKGKFALAVNNVYTDLPPAAFQLSDGTWVMPCGPQKLHSVVFKQCNHVTCRSSEVAGVSFFILNVGDFKGVHYAWHFG